MKVGFITAAMIGLLSSAISFGATYGGGSGTAVDPYQIWTPQQMNMIGANSGDWGACFKLMADIDMSIYTGTQYNIIGNSSTKFTGTFDGMGHVIRNLTCDMLSGLFGQTANARIENLGLENVNIYSVLPGSLVGVQNGGIISNCYSGGIVSGGIHVGGLVSSLQNDGLIINCHTSGVVAGNGDEVGGLVGHLYSGTVNNCYSTANVSGRNMIGGLVGRQDGSIISNSYSSGSVSGDYAIGGLIGEMSMYDENDEKIISDCYARGDVSGKDEVGGLVGSAVIGVAIQNCYSTGYVTAEGPLKGGLVGNNNFVDVMNSFWDTETSGLTTSAGGTPKTTAEIKTLSTFTSAGWDFTNETVNGTDNYWRMCLDGVDYPRLNWGSFDGDFACPDGVSTEDLEYFVGRWLMDNCTFSNNYCGGADLNLNRSGDIFYSGDVNITDWAAFAENWLAGI